LDVAALIVAMERFGVPDPVIDEVSTAADRNPTLPIDDVVTMLKSKGVSVANANRVKIALLPPASEASGSSIVTSSQSAASALSSPAAVSLVGLWRSLDWVGISND
jgi:hypothetical protein